MSNEKNPKIDGVTDEVKAQIQAQIDQAKELHRQQMLRRRVELAKAGVQNFAAHKLTESAQAYHTYLALLEEWKNVREGGLHPGLFDKKKDITEILLISGIYWDLVTIYDRTRGKSRLRDLQHFIDQFVLFSLGMPYQPVATETLRKYIANGKPIHKALFKKAYARLQTEKCFITGSLTPWIQPNEVERLRKFRDEKLKSTAAGRAFCDWYYLNGPDLATRVKHAPPALQSLLGRTINRLALTLPQ